MLILQALRGQQCLGLHGRLQWIRVMYADPAGPWALIISEAGGDLH